MQIKGICPIAPAVFDERGDFDYSSYRRCCAAMLKGGAHALALFGIAGEYYKLNLEEEERLISMTVDVCHQNDSPVIISNTRHATEVAVKWAKKIEASGADCMMLLPPFFLKPGVGELTRHIGALCDAVNIPVMLQYAPEATGVGIAPEVLAEIVSRHENLKYYKIECKPPGAYISKLINLLEDNGKIFIGNAGSQMIEGFRRGAVGVMPGPSMFDVYRRIYEHLLKHELNAAMSIHEKLNAMLNHIAQSAEMIIYYEKKILKRRGLIDSDYCRCPKYRSDALNDELFEYHYQQLYQFFEREE